MARIAHEEEEDEDRKDKTKNPEQNDGNFNVARHVMNEHSLLAHSGPFMASLSGLTGCLSPPSYHQGCLERTQLLAQPLVLKLQRSVRGCRHAT